jgi:pyruvate/2-oxoglutarate dehydrogenase complex dihydrolipoamide dehydrogenase (E3) component
LGNRPEPAITRHSDGLINQGSVLIMRVAMIGSGYVGLVSGACFADFGHQVTCVDKDATKIARLRDGEIPIFEPDLDRLVAVNVREKRLDFTTDLPGPVAEGRPCSSPSARRRGAAMAMPI